MKRLTAIAIFAAAIAAGCQNSDPLNEGLAPNQGTTRYYPGSREQVYAATRAVISQYYHIQSENPATGIIRCYPKDVAATRDRLLGGSPARQIATAVVQAEAGEIPVQIYVMQQRQGTDVIETMGYSQERYNYSGAPGDTTPIDEGAATTPKQNETWQYEKEVRDVETRILNDIAQDLK